MAMRVAALLRDGEYVNLGIGLPTLVLELHRGPRRHAALRERHPRLRRLSRRGRRGHRPLQRERPAGDARCRGRATSTRPCRSRWRARAASRPSSSARFQVAPNGDLANWSMPSTGAGGIGGAMDLAAGGRGGGRMIVVMLPAREERRVEAGAGAHLSRDRARLREARGHRPGVLRRRRPTASCCASSRRASRSTTCGPRRPRRSASPATFAR